MGLVKSILMVSPQCLILTGEVKLCFVAIQETYLIAFCVSWNNISNSECDSLFGQPSYLPGLFIVIYIDQPIGTGFSFGTDTVNSTLSAAPIVWQAFQVLFESKQFAKFQSREFIFATESYGGHYGPAFVNFFNQQNVLIESGAIFGEKITVSALMINKYVFLFLWHSARPIFLY